MIKTLALVLTVALLALAAPAIGQAVCDSAAAPTTSVCNDQNHLSWIMPVTNKDGSPLNDYSNVEIIFGPNANPCVVTAGTTVKNMGALAVPPTPLPNTSVNTLLGAVGFAKGKVFAGVRVVDLTGNRGDCTPDVQFTYDPIPPGTATNVKVGP